MIKIAYITTPITYGGSDKVNLQFLRSIDSGKYLIYPITMIRPWEKETYYEIELQKMGYTVSRIPVARFDPIHGRDFFRVPRCFRMIKGILRDERIDIVHTHGYFADIVGLLAAKKLHIQGISTCHGFIDNDWKLRFYNSLDKLLLRLADRIIAVSEDIGRTLVKSGIKENVITIIENCVTNTHDFPYSTNTKFSLRKQIHLNEKDYVIGYVGRISREKGLEVLIRSVSKVRDAEIPVKLLIVGEGEYRPFIEKIVDQENLKDRVRFLGFQTDAEKWFRAMDVFVLPSFTEGTPMAMLEAMSSGVPVVASRVGGIPNVIIHQTNGYLFPPGDENMLVDILSSLYRTPREDIPRNALRTVQERYDFHPWYNKITLEYDNLVNRRI